MEQGHYPEVGHELVVPVLNPSLAQELEDADKICLLVL